MTQQPTTGYSDAFDGWGTLLGLFDWFLGLEHLALYILGKGSFTGTHNGWETMLGHCINCLNLICFLV